MVYFALFILLNKQYDKNAISAEKGKKYEITLKNIGKLPKAAMGHNLILLKPGIFLNAPPALEKIPFKVLDTPPKLFSIFSNSLACALVESAKDCVALSNAAEKLRGVSVISTKVPDRSSEALFNLLEISAITTLSWVVYIKIQNKYPFTVKTYSKGILY